LPELLVTCAAGLAQCLELSDNGIAVTGRRDVDQPGRCRIHGYGLVLKILCAHPNHRQRSGFHYFRSRAFGENFNDPAAHTGNCRGMDPQEATRLSRAFLVDFSIIEIDIAYIFVFRSDRCAVWLCLPRTEGGLAIGAD